MLYYVSYRTSTAGSEYAFERRLGSVGHRKKVPVLLHQSSLNDDKLYHNFSSSESLGSVIGKAISLSVWWIKFAFVTWQTLSYNLYWMFCLGFGSCVGWDNRQLK